MKAPGQRFLMIYSGVLTAVFVVTVASGFARAPSRMALDELDVHRINLREPDGTLRMVMSGAGRAPGIYIKGKEYAHPAGRKEAGMIFMNAEGTENGGLVFGGETDKDGVTHSAGHLSFDAYEQDQTISLDSTQDGASSSMKLVFTDYPDYSILDQLKLQESIKSLPKDQQEAKVKAFFARRGGPTPRMLLGRNGKDGTVAFFMADAQGHPRIVMKVAADGQPSLEMLDAAGKVVGQMLPTR